MCRWLSSSVRSSLQSKSLRELRPRARVRSNICLEEFPVDGHGKAMTLIIIFSVGKTDLKDGLGYEQNRP